jgi:hypothetical protein
MPAMLVPHWARELRWRPSHLLRIGRTIMFGFFMMYAVLVFLLGVGLVLKPAAAEGGEVPVSPHDSRVSFRVSAAAVALSFLLVAGLIAAYFAGPEAFRWVVSRPLDRMLTSYHWAMLAGVGLYATARLCGVKHRHSLWLFCLSLPGALTMPVTLFAALVSGAGDLLSVSFDFLLHPATWILPIIAVRQWLWLQSPKDIQVWSGFAQTCLILVAYLFAHPFVIVS